MIDLSVRDKIELVRLIGRNALSAREAAREFHNRHPVKLPVQYGGAYKFCSQRKKLYIEAYAQKQEQSTS